MPLKRENWEQSTMGWLIYMVEERPVSLLGGIVFIIITAIICGIKLG